MFEWTSRKREVIGKSNGGRDALLKLIDAPTLPHT